MVIYKDLNHVGTEKRDTTCRIPALREGILHVVSRCYVLNQLGNATSDPTAFKIPQVPSSVLAVLGLYRRSFRTLNAVESSVALSNYYLEHSLLFLRNLIGQFRGTKSLSCPQLRSPQLSCPLLSCPLLSCPQLRSPQLSCPLLSCPLLSCPQLRSPQLSCPLLSCPLLSSPLLMLCSKLVRH